MNLKDKLILESYERNAGYIKNYYSLSNLKKKMKKASSKGKYKIKVIKNKIRMKDIRYLKNEGFKIEKDNKLLCGLFSSKNIIISWIDEIGDIVIEGIKGNVGGVVVETIDMISKVSKDIQSDLME